MEKVAEKKNVEVQKNERVDAKAVQLKEKKKASAKAWKERKDKEADDRRKAAAELIKYLNDKKITLPEQYSKLLNEIANPPVHSAGSNGGIFVKLFGSEPKVGQSVTLMEVFDKTLKSKAEVDRAVKNWAEKGIIVEFKPDPVMKNSTYVIKELKK